MSDFRSEARRWLAAEPDADMRDELESLLAGADDELSLRFDGRLQFGTAGLRAAVGAGPQRMNRLVVRQAAAGLVDYLLKAEPDAADARRDHRLRRPPQERCLRTRHRSRLRGARRAGDDLPARRADAGAGVEHRRSRRGGRGGGHRLAQPAGRQRLQGVHRQRRADRVAGRRRDRGVHRPRRSVRRCRCRRPTIR